MRTALLAVLLTSIGCAAAPADAAPDWDPEYVPTFTPTAEAAPTLADAAQRWSNAAGLDVRAAAGGVPTALVDEVVLPEYPTLRPEGAVALLPFKHILVKRTTTYGVGLVMLHEVGHVLGAAELAEASPGIMNVKGDGLIHAEDLEAVCAVQECTAWVPEG